MIRKHRHWFDYYSTGRISKLQAVKNSLIYVANATEKNIDHLLEIATKYHNLIFVPVESIPIEKFKGFPFRSYHIWGIVTDITQFKPIYRFLRLVYEETDTSKFEPGFNYTYFDWIITRDGKSPLMKYIMYGVSIWSKDGSIKRYPEEIWKNFKRLQRG